MSNLMIQAQNSNEQVFRFDGIPLTTITNDKSEVWFIAKEVASVLGYKNTNEAVKVHCKGGSEMLLPSAGGIQKMVIIPESDVYRLIFRSKLPSAERFEEWVTNEVLPTIRKTGSYGNVLQVPTNFQEACLALVQTTQMIAQQSAVIEEQVEIIEELKPLAETTLELISEDERYSVNNLARLLNLKDRNNRKLGPNKLFKLLRERRIFLKDERHNEPFILYVNKGWFESKILKQRNKNNIYITKVTNLGLHELRLLFKNWGYMSENV